MGKSVQEVESWSASELGDWRAYLALLHEDRERLAEPDENELQEKLEHTLKPRQRE